jgi:glycosyltransferase involved in cell wall biosynthesis
LIKDRLAEWDVALRVYTGLMALRGVTLLCTGRRHEALVALLRGLRISGWQVGRGSIMALTSGIVRDLCYDAGRLLPVNDNGLWRHFTRTTEARAIRGQFAAYPEADRVRLRLPRPDDDPERQGDLIVLKPYDPSTGERGVLLVTYSEALRRFAAMYDLGAIATRYMLVAEPSSWGYEHPTFFLFLGSDLDVVVEAPWRRDFEYLKRLGANLVPTRIGAGDWVDPEMFRPAEGRERTYDLVMVSAWDPIKRHEDLFEALARLRMTMTRALRVALIGYPAAWTRADIERLMRTYAVDDCCTVYENVSHAEVARIVSDARAYVLLSRREGANRALYEALFCDTPVVVYRHHRGVNVEAITAEQGALFDRGELEQAILRVLEHPSEMHPRAWALANTGYLNSTRALNSQLRALAHARGLPWTRDIVAKKMAPQLRYAEPGLYRQFDAEYNALAKLLLPAL